MITLYLLKGCKHCTNVIKYLSKNPVNGLLISVLTRENAILLKKKDSRLKSFPILFLDLPKKDGTPKKNVKAISGSSTIINYFKSLNKKMKYGEQNKILNGSNIDINFYNNNDGNINNIREYRSNCFGKSEFDCHVMDRPFDPMDNKFLLQNYQPKCAIPQRSDLPIQNNFGTSEYGNPTPGTAEWKAQRQPWLSQKIPLAKCKQNQNGLNINYPMQHKDNHINTKQNCKSKTSLLENLKSNLVPKSKFGKYKSALDNSGVPFLTYGAGGTTNSRISNDPYFFRKQQNPIDLQSNGFISGNLKNHVKNSNKFQPGLKAGLQSDFSINAQGIKSSKFGNPNISDEFIRESGKLGYKYNPWTLAPTAFDREQGNFALAQYFRRDMFPYNGNAFGQKTKTRKNKIKTEKSSKKNLYGNKTPKVGNSNINDSKNKQSTKYVSPLGIEITF